MSNTTHLDQIQLLQALKQDLTTALADLKKIKDKLGIDQPTAPPSPGTSSPRLPVNPPGGPLVQ